jgi:sensor histidine kinase YesM
MAVSILYICRQQIQYLRLQMQAEPSYRKKSVLLTVAAHIFMWIAYIILPMLFVDTYEARYNYLVRGGFFQVLMIAYFYLNYAILIPKLLLRRRTIWYFLILLSGFFAVCVIHVTYSYLTYELFEHRRPFSAYRSALFCIYPSITIFAMSTGIRLTTEWFQNERQKKVMETEKLTAELAFLKSQINPHFLFNTLNNICSLARKKSDVTENAIIRLSQIMRYMLDDSHDTRVSLSKEVEYLHNYIELQRLRLTDKVKIQITVEGNPEFVLIEPLLLIPFVENAFKHGVSYLEEAEIRIELKIQETLLTFQVENNVIRFAEAKPDPVSGIGLKNIKRRLDLLYPEKHALEIQDNGIKYHVMLRINLD